MLRVLNVAEKNEAAKGIAQILSNGHSQRRESFSKFNKIYEFDFNVQLFNANVVKMVFTSVSGHLLNVEFVGNNRKWAGVPINSLFDAPVEKFCEPNNEPIRRTLENEAKKCSHLIIWTDCDREGENIGFEIIDVCKLANRRLNVFRARFSEITRAGVNRAVRNLVNPSKNTSDAVECRRELDLRIGAAFTRFQTLLAQKEFPEKLAGALISYGSCQFPTLGFVVERYKSAENFIAEPFWKLVVRHNRQEIGVEFHWGRVKSFDKQVCETLLAVCRERPTATVERVTIKPKTKRRPVALETIVLEKSASRKLHISAKRTMDVAQKLYTKGYISYPRTETNRFPKDIDLRALVEMHTGDHRWGHFVQNVLAQGVNPHNGNKSDEAHPPIHPIRHAGPHDLDGDEARVYEFVARHFLACVSADAQGLETTVDIDIAREKFSASGLRITERNYLEVYPYDVWSDKTVPEYVQGEQFEPDGVEMNEGITTAPPLLTEADLIALMEKHGIGTDATHAEHIETIKDRRYVALNENNRFVPGYLGLGLVEGYDSMGYRMSKPDLRRELENDLKRICEGTKQKDVVLREQIESYRRTFERAYAESRRLVESLTSYFANGRGNNIYQTGLPRGGGQPRHPPPSPPAPRGGGSGGTNNNDDDDNDDDRPNPPPYQPFLNNQQQPHRGGLLCNCGSDAVERTVKKAGPNLGRTFYCCLKNVNDPGKCNFFMWADGQASNTQNAAGGRRPTFGGTDENNDDDQRPFRPSSSSSNIPYSTESRRQPVIKGSYGRGGAARGRGKGGGNSFGVNHNADDLFPTIIQFNKNFKYSRRGRGRGRSRGGGGGSSSESTSGGRKCSYCKQPGHTANRCPQKV